MQKSFSIYSKNKNIVNRRTMLVKLWGLIIIINIIKVTKIATNPASYRKILKINTAKSIIHPFIMLKITDINIHQKPPKKINLEKIPPILINSKRYLKKPGNNK